MGSIGRSIRSSRKHPCYRSICSWPVPATTRSKAIFARNAGVLTVCLPLVGRYRRMARIHAGHGVFLERHRPMPPAVASMWYSPGGSATVCNVSRWLSRSRVTQERINLLPAHAACHLLVSVIGRMRVRIGRAATRCEDDHQQKCNAQCFHNASTLTQGVDCILPPPGPGCNT